MATGGGCSHQMSDSDDITMNQWLKNVKNAEVMILCSSEDIYQISKIVLEHFRKRGVKYIIPEEHFGPGELTLQMLAEGIDKCKNLLIVANFDNSHLPLDTIAALKKCQFTSRHNLVVLVLEDYGKRNLPEFLQLQNATFVQMDYNAQEIYLDDIIRNIRDHHKDLPPQSYKTTIIIDTNDPGHGCITYEDVETTDYYREGRPYKLFDSPNSSRAKVKFNLEKRELLSVTLMLNHCSTTGHGKIDIIVNDFTLVIGFQEARWDNFGEQNFDLPLFHLHHGENKLKIELNRSSEGVYWLSDLRLDIEYA